MKIPALRKATVIHPKESRQYSVEVIGSWEICEFINRSLPHFATRFVVNIGAFDGKSYDDPCFPLFELGYGGVAFEGNENPDLVRNLPSPKIKKVTGVFVTPSNVASLLTDAETPKHFDFLKIDVDGYDGLILNAILNAGYCPKFIQLEINPEIPPPFEFSVMYHPNYCPQDSSGRFTGFYGMSIGFASRIARQYGYHIVHMDNITPATHDIVLAKDDLASVLQSDTNMDSAKIRQRFLAHPPPSWFHFGECGFDPLNWRYRTEYAELGAEIFNACLVCCASKHQGKVIPFYFGLALD